MVHEVNMMLEDYSWRVVLGPIEDELFIFEAPSIPLEKLLERQADILIPRSKIPLACKTIETIFFIGYGQNYFAKVICNPLDTTFTIYSGLRGAFMFPEHALITSYEDLSLSKVLLNIARLMCHLTFHEEQVKSFLKAIGENEASLWDT
jgi:hypothetical protein